MFFPSMTTFLQLGVYKSVNLACVYRDTLIPDYSPCGESDHDSRGRMVGGKRASRGRWPWQVGLHRVNTDGTWLFLIINLQSNYQKREHLELINDFIIGFLISLFDSKIHYWKRRGIFESNVEIKNPVMKSL